MVLEVAEFDVLPGADADFEAGYRSVVGVLRQSPGLLSVRMTHGVETPTRFVLLVEWESLHAHQAFRDSDRYPIWRGGISRYFAEPPRVEHFTPLD